MESNDISSTNQIDIEQPLTKLSLTDLLSKIEQNSGPTGLDLSGLDLSGLDMGAKAIETIVEERGIDIANDPPSWLTIHIWGIERMGIRLKGVNLENANLQRANLYGADINNANLVNADLRDSSLRATNLYKAQLNNARLWRADMREAIAASANFDQASLYRANLAGAQLQDAILADTILDGANFTGAQVTRTGIGSHILNEDAQRFEKAVLRDDPQLSDEEKFEFFRRRLRKARSIYVELLSSFLSHGYYDDASWAHFRLREVERQMHSPQNAPVYYAEALVTEDLPSMLRKSLFHLHHFLQWIGLWAAKLSCGYGEKPFRTIGWAVSIIVLFWLVFWGVGGIKDVYDNVMTPLDYLNYSLGAFTTIGFSAFAAQTPLAQTLTSFEALLGILTLALLMFALGVRITRS